MGITELDQRVLDHDSTEKRVKLDGQKPRYSEPLAWWELQRKTQPHLARMASAYLTAPGIILYTQPLIKRN